MALILTAAATKIGTKKLNIVFNIDKDFSTQEKHYFLLPDDRSKFVNLLNDIYSRPGPILPTPYSGPEGKKLFKENFIDYTLDQNYSSVSVDKINTHYQTIFTLRDADFDTLAESISNANMVFSRFFKEAQKKQDQTLLDYLERHPDLPNIPEKPSGIPPTPAAGDKPIATPDILPTPAAARASEPPGTARKPASDTQRPVQEKNLTALQQTQLENLSPSIAETMDGINGDRLVEGVPENLLYPGDNLIKGANNAGVHLTRDEEYRFKGHTGAGACYIYAGRSPQDPELELQDGEFGAGSNTVLRTPNNLKKDAAYVYISQKADPDSLLGVVGGTYGKKAGPRKGVSLATLKADDVVINARQSGIRLVTGTDTSNSKGGRLMTQFGIDLIAGNDDSDLQSMVKGENLVKYLKALSKAVDNLQSTLYKHIQSQLEFNSKLATHTHYDPFLILLGTMGFGNPLGVMEGKNLPSPEVTAGGTKVLIDDLQNMQSAISQAFNRINNDFNGLEKVGAYNILSPLNRTT